jgi:hypothetical protein
MFDAASTQEARLMFDGATRGRTNGLSVYEEKKRECAAKLTHRVRAEAAFLFDGVKCGIGTIRCTSDRHCR